MTRLLGCVADGSCASNLALSFVLRCYSELGNGHPIARDLSVLLLAVSGASLFLSAFLSAIEDDHAGGGGWA